MKRDVVAQVRKRAAGRCEYCLLPQRAIKAPFHIEHIIPRKHGGSDAPGNLALACHWCNRFKGTNLSGIDPQTGSVVTLFHPRHLAWAEHFTFDGPTLLGLTPTGRATVRVLKMNAPALWSIRCDLLKEGVRFRPRSPRRRL